MQAQEQTLRCKMFKVTADTLVLDSLPVAPSMIQNKGLFIAPNRFLFHANIKEDSLMLCYRVFLPSRFKTKYALRNPLENSDNPAPIDLNPIVPKKSSPQDQIFTNGSVSRGISSGSNQGLLINSDLNLQMQGDLGKGVKLTAAVSDNNSPLQPDGTTLQIQDFDRVFVKIEKDSWFAVAGDYFMKQQPDNHFLAFNKKSRGLQHQGIYQSNYFDHIQSQTHAAVSRGRFSRNEIQGIEGIQGPYRLQGSQNETFIIIIAATEVVYVDGKKLARGEQNDYVINYNTAELIFNPNILITQYSRIVVEFQYADQNYSRVLFDQGLGIAKNRLKVRANYFLEQDNKNQPFQAENELSLFDSSSNQDAKQVLAQAGDDPEKAVISTIRLEPNFSTNKILYRKIDSLGTPNVLVYQPVEISGGLIYSAIFTNVGAGKGNYIQVNNSANGRVYAWVQPVAGQPQGDYEPVTQLVAPVRQQMATAALEYKLNEHLQIAGELAYSQLNSNTFSELNKGDDDALGSFFRISQDRQIKDSVQLKNTIYWERVSSGFAYIERYRNVEFERKWNRSLINPSSTRINNTEQIIQYDGEVKTKKGAYVLGMSTYQIDELFQGLSPSLGITQQLGKRFQMSAEGNYMASENRDSLSTKAYQVLANTGYRINQSSIFSIFAQAESNAPELNGFDSFTASAFQFQSYGATLNHQKDNGWNLSTTVNLRTDQKAIDRKFLWVSDGLNISANVSRVHGNKRIALISSLRFLDQNVQFYSAKKEQFLQQRVEYADNNHKRGYKVNFYLQSGTGREQKREFVFIEVPAGQGQYTWNDYNSNGVKEVNEFELSVFKDQAKYIKVYNLTNQFINANQHEGNLSLNLRPANWFVHQKLLQNMSNQFNMRIVQRNNRKSLFILNPFVSDSTVLSGSSLLRNSLIYNSAKLGIEFTLRSTQAKQQLTYGTEENVSKDIIVKSRYNMGNHWQFDIEGENSNRQLNNDFFENRNFDWLSNVAKASISWQNLKTRVAIIGALTQGSGSEGSSTDLKQTGQELSATYFYNMNVNTNLDASIKQSKITFNGSSNSPLGFQILNGLSAGDNYQWNLNLRTLVSKNIQITIGYEGRKIPELSVIHIGRAEARYLF